MSRFRISAASALCVVGAFLALLLLSKHYGVALLGEAVMAACGPNEGCDVVSQSRYASFAGLPLAAWGLYFYGSLLALLLPAVAHSAAEGDSPAPSLALGLVSLALVLDAGLFLLQAFVIKAFCKFCLGTYAVNAGLLIALWSFGYARATEFLSGARHRSQLLAWTIAVLAVFGTTVSLNAALVDRKALSGASILGTPISSAPAETPAPAAGSVEEQLAQARAEAKKWKDTLDDEKRLQVYLTNKALSDFNQSPVAKIDVSRAPLDGPKDAPIQVVSFSDFMCPFCRDLAIGLRRFLPQTGGQVQTRYKHFPLDSVCNPQVGHSLHPGSCELSLAGICADEMGRFAEFHDSVFSRTWDKATRDDALNIGVAVGLDRAKLAACMTSQATRGLLTRDIDEGCKIGVGSTPTMFING